MIIERVSRCMLCGDEITTEGTVLNQLCVGQINDLKMEHHMRTHHKRRSLRFWYLFLSPLVILGGAGPHSAGCTGLAADCPVLGAA